MQTPDLVIPTCTPPPSLPQRPLLSSGKNPGPGGPHSLLPNKVPRKCGDMTPKNITTTMELTTSGRVTGRWRDRTPAPATAVRRDEEGALIPGVGREGAGLVALTTGAMGAWLTAAATIPSVTALEIKAAKAPIDTSPPGPVDGGGPELSARELPAPEPPARELPAPPEPLTLEELRLPTSAGVTTVVGNEIEPDDVRAAITKKSNKISQITGKILEFQKLRRAPCDS